jgi:methanogenic corrinoid protein MtbC1
MVAVRQQVVTRDCWTEAEALAAARDGFAARLSGQRGAAEINRQSLVTRTVETQVIPRLLLARRVMPDLIAVPALSDQTEQVTALVALVLGRELPAVSGFVDGLLGRGALPETLYLDLLAPAARRLGDLWRADQCDFTEVTVGLWRLQHVMRDLGPLFHGHADLTRPGPRALFVPLPGEQHTFGLMMVVDFFRRAGWTVWSGALASGADLARLVHNQSFALIGFSVACGDRLEEVVTAIRAVRRASRNRNAGIMVGGPLFVEHPEYATSVGADATDIDGRQAVQQAQTLLSLMTGQR